MGFRIGDRNAISVNDIQECGNYGATPTAKNK